MKNVKYLLLAFIIITSCNTDGGFSSSSGGLESSENPNGNGNTDAGQVTAAEWNDLENWSFWTDLMSGDIYAQSQTQWDFFTANRLAFEIVDPNENPVNGAQISLYKDGIFVTEAKSDNFGKANLFIDLNVQHYDIKNLEPYSVTVNSLPITHSIVGIAHGVNRLVVDNVTTLQDKIELAFIVDATGSMGDELEFLKNDLQDVIATVQNDNTSSSIITGTVFYRDTEDEYVVRHSDFTSNVHSTINFIEEQYASGGGDFPEAVHTALNTAMYDLQWSSNAKTKIAFLLLDAPPHGGEQVIESLHISINEAAKQGIKIIPITASGINKSTEFLMRFFAIATNGTYVFITDDSGIGNDHLEASVGEYQVEFLNELMVRLINKYSE